MNDAVLQAEGLSKKFCRSLKRSLWYGVSDMAHEAFLSAGKRDELRKGEFWALKDVTFELHRGETLGLIGQNGAGKSTLLKLINGLIRPDQGRARVCGRVGALIALGTGFHPELTGRENIYVNAAVLGLSKREVDKRLDEIIDFAEIGDFIDAPLQSYSSGMKVRLGFSVAANLNPDILLIDEVLSVGDSSFRNRCLRHLDDYREQGGTVIFVSHNTTAVEAISDRVLWLDHGRTRKLAEPGECIREYEAEAQAISQEADERLGRAPASAGAVVIESATCRDLRGNDRAEFDFHEPFQICVRYRADGPVESPHFMVGLKKDAPSAPPVCLMHTMWLGIDLGSVPQSGVVACTLDRPSLAPGTYYIQAGVQRAASVRLGEKWYCQPADIGTLMIRPGGLTELFPGAPAVVMVSRIPPMITDHSWALNGEPLPPAFTLDENSG